MRHLILAAAVLLTTTASVAAQQPRCTPSIPCAITLARADAARVVGTSRDNTLLVSIQIESAAIFARAGMRAEAQASFDDARDRIARIRNEDTRRSWTRILASALAMANMTEGALAIAESDQDVPERLRIFRVAIVHQVAEGRQNEALQIAARAGAERNSLLLEAVQTLAETNRIDQARTLATALPAESQDTVRYLIAQALRQRGDHAGSAAAFASIEAPTVTVLHDLAAAQYAAGDRAAAHASMRLALAQAHSNGVTNEIQALVLVNLLTQLEMFDEALARVSQTPNDERAGLIAEIAVAQAWQGHADAAMRTGAMLESYPFGREYREEMLAGIAAGRAVSGEPWRPAFADITDLELRQTYLSDAAETLAFEGRIDVAREMLREAAATAQRVQPRDESDAVLTEVARAQITSGLFDEARVTIDLIRAAPVRAAALAQLAEALHTAGDTAAARATFAATIQLARSDAQGRDTLMRLPSQMAERGMLTEALALARTLPTGNQDDAFEASFALGDVAEGYARANDANTAFSIVADMENPQIRSAAYIDIARAMLSDS